MTSPQLLQGGQTPPLQLNSFNPMFCYPRKEYDQPVKRYCQTLELKNDKALIEKYIKAHDRYHHWPEISEGIKAVGILEMEIYIYENKLFMIVETPEDFEWDKAFAKLATMPRQAEWEDYVSMFQQCEEGSTSNEKWHLMDRIFHLYE